MGTAPLSPAADAVVPAATAAAVDVTVQVVLRAYHSSPLVASRPRHPVEPPRISPAPPNPVFSPVADPTPLPLPSPLRPPALSPG